MRYFTEGSRSREVTRVTRGHLRGKAAGVVVTLAFLLGGGVSASGLTIQGAGVVGNGLMLSLFGAARTPPVTTVAPLSPAPVLDNEIPTNTSSGALPAPPQVVESPPAPLQPAAPPPPGPAAPDLTLPPQPVAAVPAPPAAVVASAYVMQLVGIAAPPPPDPMNAALPWAAPVMEAPEPGARLLLWTGLLVLAGICRRRCQPRTSGHGILNRGREGPGGSGASLA